VGKKRGERKRGDECEFEKGEIALHEVNYDETEK
jgi:hypothetical protein